MTDKKNLLWIALLCIALAGVCIVYIALAGPGGDTREGLSLHFIDVGKGDAALVTVNGEAILVDAGYDDTEKATATYILQNGVSRLNAVILTHFDKDHIGGAEYISERIPVSAVYAPPYTGSGSLYDSLVFSLAARGKALEAIENGHVFNVGGRDGAVVRVLAPVSNDYNGDNDWSVVLMLEYRGRRILLTGDIETEAVKDILAEHSGSLKADIMKWPHHGKKGSVHEELFAEVSPSFTVISTASIDGESLPHSSVTEFLSQKEVTVYRTDLNGSIVFHIDADGGITAEAEK